MRMSPLLLLACMQITGYLSLPTRAQDKTNPTIQLWYGDEQGFGRWGHPQRWINLLGEVFPASELTELGYALNDGPRQPLSFHEDFKRIARTGNFNIEIARAQLNAGRNTVQIFARFEDGRTESKLVVVNYTAATEKNWPIPFEIDWSHAQRIDAFAQVVDGKWELTHQGVRAVERYYDRVLAVGDASWTDYEIQTSIRVHALTGPNAGSNKTNVTHAAIALRWPGHDQDGLQPSVKWYPLGATAEFRLGADLQQCRWRIFDGKREFHTESDRRRRLEFDTLYQMKHRVESLDDGRSRYRSKLWPASQPEPAAWDLERLESGDLTRGSALLLAHHSDVTFGNVFARPLRAPEDATPRKPVLVGDSWPLNRMPDLKQLAGPDPEQQHIVDHSFFRDSQGDWRLWACIRGTSVGRIIFGWRGSSLRSGVWSETGIALRVLESAGERMAEGQEHIGAPHILRRGDQWHCFYHSQGIHQASSTDGIHFQRVLNVDGLSRCGIPGGRDVMVMPFEGRFYSYATVTASRERSYIVGSWSDNLKDWAVARIVREGGRGGSGPVASESPFVVALDGYFYLFRASSHDGNTYVYRSLDPLSFGADDSNLIAVLPLKAPEILQDSDGRWLVSDLDQFQGIRMHDLEWVSDSNSSIP